MVGFFRLFCVENFVMEDVSSSKFGGQLESAARARCFYSVLLT